jgi:hypothetical protein
MIDNLRACAGEAIPTKDAHELALLERLLRNTPVLVRKRNVQPKNEKEVRDVMHDYLEATLTEYWRDVKITGIIRDFKPDGGVRKVGRSGAGGGRRASRRRQRGASRLYLRLMAAVDEKT